VRYKFSKLERGVELGTWILGLTLLCVYFGARFTAEQARAQGVQQFKEARSSAMHGGHAASSRERRSPDQSLWSAERVAAYAESASRADPPDGLLRIPSLKLEVPLYRGTSEINLNRGAAHIEGTAPLASAGNIGIAAHRDGFFRPLKDARLGHEIHLDTHGRSLRYRITEISIVSPSDVQVLAPTKMPSLTLVTCYPFYFVGNAPRRYIVRAELADTPSAIAQN
jgi:sortase A